MRCPSATPLFRSAICRCSSTRAFDGIDHAAEFGQQAVAGQLEDAAVMSGDFGFEEVFPVRAQALERVRLIILHEAAVADDVDREDRG